MHFTDQFDDANLDRSTSSTGALLVTDTLAPLILDFLEWLAPAPRPYAEVVEAWRTSCPRLTVWEDAADRGFVVRRREAGEGLHLDLTPLGRRFLLENGRLPMMVAGLTRHAAVSRAS
jgi:hypothetical protein